MYNKYWARTSSSNGLPGSTRKSHNPQCVDLVLVKSSTCTHQTVPRSGLGADSMSLDKCAISTASPPHYCTEDELFSMRPVANGAS